VIDTLRKQIQGRLDQVLAEAEKLRKALVALDPRSAPPPSKPKVRSRAAGRPRQASAIPAPARTTPGATKARVLSALSQGQEMTAGEVAAATGLARGTVSTTLTRLAKTGEICKAQRGYALPSTTTQDGAAAGSTQPEGPSAA
jgi:DNA-binding transcriptional ArsR family regulator